MSTSISEHARQEELLPCPFCGGEAEFDEMDKRLSLTCMNPVCEFDMWFRLALNRDGITRWWNTRAIDSATAAKEREIERLKDKLGDIAADKGVVLYEDHLAEMEAVGLQFHAAKDENQALQARVRELKESLAWTLDHLDEDVEKIHHRKVTDCRQALQP